MPSSKQPSSSEHDVAWFLTYSRAFLQKALREVDKALEEVGEEALSAPPESLHEHQRNALARVLTVEALLRKGLGLDVPVSGGSTHNGRGDSGQLTSDHAPFVKALLATLPSSSFAEEQEPEEESPDVQGSNGVPRRNGVQRRNGVRHTSS